MTTHHLEGHLTFQSFDILERMVAAASSCQESDFVLDLSQVAFMDTFALSMIQLARTEITQRGAAFSITGASGTVDYLLRHGGGDSDAEPVPVPVPVILLHDAPLSDASLQWCDQLGFQHGGTDCPVPEGSAWVNCGCGTPDAIRSSLERGGAGFIEQTGQGDVALGRHGVAALEKGGFVVSVTTTTANQVNLVEYLTEAIRQRFPARRRESDSLVDLCLGEAISNSVIHGNLGISSSMRTMSDRFRAFYTTMKERLADPVRGGKRVEISLMPLTTTSFTISVCDEGDGFDVGKELSKPLDPTAMYGHGLPMIRKIASSVWADDGGRCLVMQF